MANSQVIQAPLYRDMLVGQNLFFTVVNDTAVATQTKVKFCAELYVDTDFYPIAMNAAQFAGTFKTTPNNEGSGQWDFRNVMEGFVRPDNMAYKGSEYKGQVTDDVHPFPLHIIDKWSQSEHLAAYFRIKFYVEYVGGNPLYPDVVMQDDSTVVMSSYFKVYDGYVKHSDALNKATSTNLAVAFNYGFNLSNFFIHSPYNHQKFNQRWLTNMPMTTPCNDCDYGTISCLLQSTGVKYVKFEYHLNNGTLNTENIDFNAANGAYAYYQGYTNQSVVHLGCYPGNLSNWSAMFNILRAGGLIQGGHYTVQCHGFNGLPASEVLRIDVNCPELKGFLPIRLAWLNQYGGWDYWTFTKKSIRKIKTKPTTYTQLGSTWNERHNKLEAFRGGQKNFKRHSLERVQMNTDWLSEDYNVIFEELINSPEVYLLDCHNYGSDARDRVLHTYCTPTRLTDSDFTYKTLANDKLVQYSFEIELSKILRTQQV